MPTERKSRLLTIDQLIEKNACREQVDLFRQHFGDKVNVTRAKAIRFAGVFDWDWAASYLLDDATQAEYDKVCDAAWAEYDKVRDAAWTEYDKVRAATQAEYDKVRAATRAEYLKVRAAAWAEYDKVRAATRAEYLKVRAAAFADAYVGGSR